MFETSTEAPNIDEMPTVVWLIPTRLAIRLPLLPLNPTPDEVIVISWPLKLPLLDTPIAISSKCAPSKSVSPLFLTASKSM